MILNLIIVDYSILANLKRAIFKYLEVTNNQNPSSYDNEFWVSN